jgi:hypothetical protein
MKTTLLVTMFFALVLSMNGGSSKPTFDGIACDPLGCDLNTDFNFSNLNNAYTYDVEVTEVGGLGQTDRGTLTPDLDGTGAFSFGNVEAGRYEVVLTEIHKNGNLAHSPAIDEFVDVP